MAFDIDLRHRIGARHIQFSCSTGPGLIALTGPSGVGKTSVLNMIAGLIAPDWGHISVNGEMLFDSAERIDVPVHRRRAGYVFQDVRLFPHLTVRRNLRYGSHGGSAIAMEEVVDLLGIDHLLNRRPATLSGGEAQRVAIGRALLSGAQFLLLDEPLSAMDQARRTRLLPLVDRIKQVYALPILFVSHDPVDVARFADDVVDMPYPPAR